MDGCECGCVRAGPEPPTNVADGARAWNGHLSSFHTYLISCLLTHTSLAPRAHTHGGHVQQAPHDVVRFPQLGLELRIGAFDGLTRISGFKPGGPAESTELLVVDDVVTHIDAIKIPVRLPPALASTRSFLSDQEAQAWSVPSQLSSAHADCTPLLAPICVCTHARTHAHTHTRTHTHTHTCICETDSVPAPQAFLRETVISTWTNTPSEISGVGTKPS